MEKIQKSTLFALLCSCLLISSSCTVYYPTSDIDAKISSNINSANDNCNRVIGQITTFENDYKNLKCISTESPYSDALKSMNEINQCKLQMQSLQTDLSKLYLDFKSYTTGKDKIASNSSEWKLFKTTKKSLKSKFKELQTTGEKTVKKAEEFNLFVNEKIVPIVTMVDIEAFRKNLDDSQKSFNTSQKELEDKLLVLESDLTRLKRKNRILNKDKIALLEKDMDEMKIQRNELAIVKSKWDNTILLFNQKMSGKTRIYSCSSEWEVVKDTEQSFAELQGSCTTIQTTILGLYAHMLQVISEIKE
jgi:hypothetical protein